MAHRRAPQADLDLDDIWCYIAAKSGSADIADRLVDSITDRFFLMANHPYLGRARDDLRPGLRSFPVAEYVIICPFVRDSCNRLEYTGRVNLRKRSP